MKEIEKRIDKLEKQTLATSRPRPVEVLTDDELAVIVTGDPKASDLTDDDLKAALGKYRADHPDTDIIEVVSKRAKELTERIIAGEGTE